MESKKSRNREYSRLYHNDRDLKQYSSYINNIESKPLLREAATLRAL